MEINRADGELAREKKIKFRYFVDANVVAAYAYPANKDHYFQPLARWLHSSDLRTATSTLLVEFLFSGKLPGQEHGAPVYLTPSHYEELGSMAQGIAAKATSRASTASRSLAHKTAGNVPVKRSSWGGAPQDEMGREVAEVNARRSQAVVELREIYDSMVLGSLKAADAVERIYPILPHALLRPTDQAGELQRAVIEMDNLRNLIQSNRIAHAESERWFHAELFAPDRKLTKWFAHHLNVLRQGDSRCELVYADVVSIVQIMMLEAECSADTRYVLITADNAIKTLYQAYQQHESEQGRTPMVLNLRHPRDYVPLINIRSMSSIDSTDEQLRAGGAFAELENTQAAVFDRIEIALRKLEAETALPEKNWNASEREVHEQWNRAASYAVLRYAGVIANREKVEIDLIGKLLSKEDFRTATINHLNDAIVELGYVHWDVRYGNNAQAKRIIASLRSVRKRLPRRAPLLFRKELFQSLIGEEPINTFLDRLAVGDASIRLNFVNKENAETFLFMACVAAADESWTWARTYAERAHEEYLKKSGTNREALFEAKYCLAMAIRFTMKDGRDMKRARQLLDECILEHGGRRPRQVSRLLRAESEAGALLATFLFKQHWAPSFADLTSSEQKGISGEASEYLQNAVELLDEVRLASSRDGNEVVFQRVGLQAFSNKASLAIYNTWVLNFDIKPALSNLRLESSELRDRMNKWEATSGPTGDLLMVPKSVEIPAKILEVLVAQDEGTRRIKVKEARALIVDALEGLGELAEMDRQEFQFYLGRLNEL